MHPEQQDVEHRYHNRLLAKPGRLNWKLTSNPPELARIAVNKRNSPTKYLVVDAQYWPSHTHLLDRGISLSHWADRIRINGRADLLARLGAGDYNRSADLPYANVISLLSNQDIMVVLRMLYYSAVNEVLYDTFSRQQAALVSPDRSKGMWVAIVQHSHMQYVYDAVASKLRAKLRQLLTAFTLSPLTYQQRDKYSLNRGDNLITGRRNIEHLYRTNILHKLLVWRNAVMTGDLLGEGCYQTCVRSVGNTVRNDTTFAEFVKTQYSMEGITREPLRN